MGIDIIELTPDGDSLSKSANHAGDADMWAVVYFLGRVGKRSTVDKITMVCFGGDRIRAQNTIRKLRVANLVR